VSLAVSNFSNRLDLRAKVSRVGSATAAKRRLTFTAANAGEYVSGRLVGSTRLAGDRLALPRRENKPNAQMG
jgi:hypothetical protein